MLDHLIDRAPDAVLVLAIVSSFTLASIHRQGIAVLSSNNRHITSSTVPFWSWVTTAAWIVWVFIR